MQIIDGSIRKVLVFDNFVIKLPRLLSWSKNAKYVFKQCVKYKSFKKGAGGYFRLLFIPIKVNWSEFLFYQKTHHVFCAKTYFSFFGLFNIQEKATLLQKLETGHEYNFERYSEYHDVIEKVVYQSGLKLDFSAVSHTYNNPYNFAFSKINEFVCLDYSEKVVQEVILSLGVKIQEAFKDWNKIKPLE